MPLIVEGGRIPPAWAEKKGARATIPIDSFRAAADCIRIALVNNMPDPALADTEMQFLELLETTAGNVPVRIKLFSLPGIPRGEHGLEHLRDFYFAFDDLWNSSFDAAIITGTEPHTPGLRDEPYWPVLAQLLDWAERHTISTVLSCLAAHAGVLHSDDIERHRLSDKRFGVFDFAKTCDHALTRQAQQVRFPHSRWNELRAQQLKAAGYLVLTESAEAGVDCFIKEKRNSLFVHFQGHPEYSDRTLLKEYRRDIKRFLRGERETYPSMPQGYFDNSSARLLMEFKHTALSHPSEAIFSQFPDTVENTLQHSWHMCATSIYRSWLELVHRQKNAAARFVAVPASVSFEDYKRRPAVQ